MASGAAQTFRHSLQAVLKGQHGFDDESQYNILAMVPVSKVSAQFALPRGLDHAEVAQAGSKLNGNSRDHTQIFQGCV